MDSVSDASEYLLPDCWGRSVSYAPYSDIGFKCCKRALGTVDLYWVAVGNGKGVRSHRRVVIMYTVGGSCCARYVDDQVRAHRSWSTTRIHQLVSTIIPIYGSDSLLIIGSALETNNNR